MSRCSDEKKQAADRIKQVMAMGFTKHQVSFALRFVGNVDDRATTRGRELGRSAAIQCVSVYGDAQTFSRDRSQGDWRMALKRVCHRKHLPSIQ